MTRKASDRELEPHWRVRVVLPGALIHLASRSEPKVLSYLNRVTEVHGDWIEDSDYGDTIGFIDWSAVVGVTWRWSS